MNMKFRYPSIGISLALLVIFLFQSCSKSQYRQDVSVEQRLIINPPSMVEKLWLAIWSVAKRIPMEAKAELLTMVTNCEYVWGIFEDTGLDRVIDLLQVHWGFLGYTNLSTCAKKFYAVIAVHDVLV